ncbi:MAG TPA: Dabb family protein [Candidatus Limnocylindria bacterium]|nr:Dabb family protein [Candidatus Limnocylindria bacterium]
MPRFHHVVLFRLRDGADVDAAIAVLRAAEPASGLVSWQVERSLDERNGSVVAELAVFESEENFREWRSSDLHQAATTHMRDVSDWLIADWE